MPRTANILFLQPHLKIDPEANIEKRRPAPTSNIVDADIRRTAFYSLIAAIEYLEKSFANLERAWSSVPDCDEKAVLEHEKKKLAFEIYDLRSVTRQYFDDPTDMENQVSADLQTQGARSRVLPNR